MTGAKHRVQQPRRPYFVSSVTTLIPKQPQSLRAIHNSDLVPFLSSPRSKDKIPQTYRSRHLIKLGLLSHVDFANNHTLHVWIQSNIHLQRIVELSDLEMDITQISCQLLD